MTPGDLARQLAAEAGLTCEIEQDGALFEYLIQHRQSDLDFLTDVAERSGLYLTIREHTLYLLTLAGQGDAVDLTLGNELHQAQVELNADAACTEVSALGWNAARVEVFEGGVSSARSGRQVQAALDSGMLSERMLIDLGAELDAQVGGMAQAEFDRRTAAEVVFTGVADGDTRLRPGAVARISGVARDFDGAYVLTSVNHILNQTVGYISELASAPPPPRARSNAAAVTLGVITQINDPESLGRVRLALPTFDQVETDWVNVLSAGAGAGKGLMLLPEIGDEVLVLLAHEDPAQAIVLGGLYGRRGMPDAGIADGVVRRYTLLTPGGQRVRLDDTDQLIRLENSDGSFVELSPQKVHVHASVDLEIEAPGRSIIIRGNTIDFQRG
jgi:phage baseplate assembly protein gpV